MQVQHDISAAHVLLHAWRQGDREAFAQLIQHVQGELRRTVASSLRGAETPSLAAGDLLHETLIKLTDAPPDWHDWARFLRIGVSNALFPSPWPPEHGTRRRVSRFWRRLSSVER